MDDATALEVAATSAAGKERAGGEAEHRVAPVRCDVGERGEDKRSLGEQRMGEDEGRTWPGWRPVHHQGAVGQQIEVERTGGIATARATPGRPFQGLEQPNYVARRIVAPQFHNRVDIVRLPEKTFRLRPVNWRCPQPAEAVEVQRGYANCERFQRLTPSPCDICAEGDETSISNES